MGRSASDEGIAEGGTRFGEPGDVADGLAPERPRLGAGSVIDGKYRLERVLGEGGMGSVWRAQNLQLDVAVAIKLLRAGPDIASLSERMKLEARSAARLVHPAIVRVFDIDSTDSGDPYIVMELLNGESLAELLDRGRLAPIQAVQSLLPIAEALVLAHSKGIIHRDIKPQNVFIAEEGERVQPKLLDFGIAKLIGATLPAGSITDTGIMLGSPDYMSPEQARGQTDLDHRTDIWSFCVVLYEALTGTTPFHGVNYNALMRAIIDEAPLPVPEDLHIDPQLSHIIVRGLSKNRDDRQDSVGVLGRELAEWLLQQGVGEDVSGGAIERKWTGRAMQRSLPLIVQELEPAATVALVPSAPRVPIGDTLLSASDAPPALARTRDYGESRVVRPFMSLRHPMWMLVLAAVALVAVVVWAALDSGPPPAPRAERPMPQPLAATPSPPTAVSAASALNTGTLPTSGQAAVELAPTPPSPSENPLPATSTARSSKPATVAPARKIKPSPSAVQVPAQQQGRDDSNELLQAY